MSLFSLHPLAFTTAYSELKRRALELERFFVGTPGSVGARTVKGSSFLYRQYYDAMGRKVADYLGPAADPEAVVRADVLRERIALTTALAGEARTLGRQGYVRVDARTSAVLAALANHDLFRAGAVLVGSHAYGALLNDLGVRAGAFLTQDVDIARAKTLRLATRVSFATMLEESTVPLHPVLGFDRHRTATSYKAKGRDPFRVDLMIPTSGREVSTAEVPELLGHAAALPGLDYLLREPIDAVVLGRDGVVAVKVPRPEVFAWHKMYVALARTTTSEKAAKDLLQATVLVAALMDREPEALAAAFAEVPPKLLTRVRRAAARVASSLEVGGAERAAAVVRDLIA